MSPKGVYARLRGLWRNAGTAVPDFPRAFARVNPRYSREAGSTPNDRSRDSRVGEATIPITRIEGKRKMSQNRSAEDRAGVVAGLAASERASDRDVAKLIPE